MAAMIFVSLLKPYPRACMNMNLCVCVGGGLPSHTSHYRQWPQKQDIDPGNGRPPPPQTPLSKAHRFQPLRLSFMVTQRINPGPHKTDTINKPARNAQTKDPLQIVNRTNTALADLNRQFCVRNDRSRRNWGASKNLGEEPELLAVGVACWVSVSQSVPSLDILFRDQR